MRMVGWMNFKEELAGRTEKIERIIKFALKACTPQNWKI